MWLRMSSCGLFISTRLSATVTIAVPLSAIAALISALEANFPVPSRSLDGKLLPAITKSFIFQFLLFL